MGSEMCVRDRLWCVDAKGRACRFKGGEWQYFAGFVKQFSVRTVAVGRSYGPDEHELWGVDNCNRLVYCESQSRSKSEWKVLNGDTRLKHVCALRKGGQVWCVQCNGSVCIYEYSNEGGRMYALPGDIHFNVISVSEDASHIWAVDNFDNIHYRAGREGVWEKVHGQLCQMAVSLDGEHVWGVNKCGSIYYRAGRSGRWLRVKGSSWSKWPLTEVCVSGDGGQVWGIGEANNIWTFCASSHEDS